MNLDIGFGSFTRHSLLFAAAFLMILCSLYQPAYSQNCTGKAILTAAACQGDPVSAAERELYQLVSAYRKANGLADVPLSQPLSTVGNRHLLDLKHNVRTFTHSWSDCLYDIKNEATWPCLLDAPKRLNSGYDGQGYETLYRTGSGNADPKAALDAWKKSSLHSSIILNRGVFAAIPWDALGIAIDGEYAVLWFGSKSGAKANVPKGPGIGLGVTYDQAISGLTTIFSIKQTESTIEENRWRGVSADGRLVLELLGSQSAIGEASLAVNVKIDGGKLSPQSMVAITKLLENLFPEWPDIPNWVSNSAQIIFRDPTANRAKLVRKIKVEMRAADRNTLRLMITPDSKPGYFEVF